jgi:hypothetical protein
MKPLFADGQLPCRWFFPFCSGTRWGNFPSVSQVENFKRKVYAPLQDIVTDLKLRADGV